MSNDELNRQLNQPSWIWDSTDLLSIRNILARVSLRPEELRKPLTSVGFVEASWDRDLTNAERSGLRTLFQQDEVRRLALEKAARSQVILVKYLSQEGLLLIEQCVEIYSNYAYDTEIIVASVRNPLHVLESAMMGADISTIPFSVLKKLASHPMTDRGLQAFLDDWNKSKK